MDRITIAIKKKILITTIQRLSVNIHTRMSLVIIAVILNTKLNIFVLIKQ